MKTAKGVICSLVILAITLPSSVFAETQYDVDKVKISEIQTTGENGETDKEFVELINTSTQNIDITGWKLQYSSSLGVNWQTKVTFEGYILSGARMLISSNGYLPEISDGEFSSGFKMDAGHVRITKPSESEGSADFVVDLVGWGGALMPETKSANYPEPGKSITRKVKDGVEVDSNNNFDDFEITNLSPESNNTEDIAEEAIPEETEESEQEEVVEVKESIEESTNEIASEDTHLTIMITELLPNPASPKTDDEDEYIEIYNPNNEPVNLEGYKIETGNNFTYEYTFGENIIEPYGYVVVYRSDSNLVLSNTSGRARVVSPSGEVTYTTDSYEDAKEEESWSLIDGVWQWTLLPTPSVENILTVQTVLGVNDSSKSNTSKTKKKKTTTKKPKTKKATNKKKAAKIKKTKDNEDKDSAVLATTDSQDGTGFSPNTWMIAVVGIIAVGYLMYEYKDEIRNRIMQFRRNGKVRRGTGSVT